MTEQSASPSQSNPNPRKSIFYEVLVLMILLVAVIVVYTLIFRPGFIQTFIFPATPMETGMPPSETAPSETPLNGVSPSEATLTLTPLAETPSTEMLLTETPVLTETPASTTPSAPSLTPAFGSCQYTLKPGPVDYLYAIYWNWHIDKNIPHVQDYYAKISCAALLTNMKCNYQAANPNITQPGWILTLPGVSSNICSYHGGTPVP